MDLRIQWHSPDQAHAAIFLRDGEEWYLDGALVGMGSTPDLAVEDLLGIAKHLVIHGQNALLASWRDKGGLLPLADREWLFDLLDPGSDDDEMYAALRAARA